MRRFVRNIFVVLNIIAAIALLTMFASQFVRPSEMWQIAFFNYVQLFVYLLNIFFVGFWIIFKWRFSLISLFCLLLSAGNFGNVMQLLGRESSQQKGIKVLSYNVGHFQYSQKNDKNIPAVIDYITAQDADIICLQETLLNKYGNLSPSKLRRKFGLGHCQLAHSKHWDGLVTFSRFPILNMGEIRFEDSNNMVMYCDVIRDDDTIRIYNCHLQSFHINKDEYSVIDSLSFETNRIKKALTVWNKIKTGNIKREAQIDTLVESISRCKYENIVVCGDFNDIPNSYTYHGINQLLNDSFRASGQGLSKTFKYDIAPYRIDYIFFSDSFEAYDYKREKVEYSDHYPISSLLVKKAN